MTYQKWIENWIERKSPLVKESTFAASAARLLSATKIGVAAPMEKPLILDIVE